MFKERMRRPWMKIVVLGGVFSVLGVCVVLLWDRDRAIRHPPSSNKGVEEMNQRLDRLETHNRTLQVRLSSMEANAAAQPTVAAVGDAVEAEPVAKLSPREHDRLLVENARRVMEEVHVRRPRDERWTRETQDALNERVAEPEYAGSRVVAVDCKETLCKITLGHDDEEAWTKFRSAFKKEPFRTSAFFSFNPETRQSAIYVAQKGVDLPRVPRVR
jgi:hypothetical protein